tara:strand:+ start:1118 stop:1333 length:216 start_codon:yes stop_codon:yes gene_type:complete
MLSSDGLSLLRLLDQSIGNWPPPFRLHLPRADGVTTITDGIFIEAGLTPPDASEGVLTLGSELLDGCPLTI